MLVSLQQRLARLQTCSPWRCKMSASMRCAECPRTCAVPSAKGRLRRSRTVNSVYWGQDACQRMHTQCRLRTSAKLKQAAQERLRNHGSVKRAVISVPSCFNMAQREVRHVLKTFAGFSFAS